ncbi:MAG: hypothetical protein JWO56_543, partial [Acidobacteria bacterium]|nr:hypothetical protein [Acidobacteriota bacterium]
MTDHLDRLRLFAYAEGANDVDRVAVAAHLGTCTSCRAALYEMQQSLLLLGDGSVLGFLADSESDTERFDLRARLETLAAEETAADVAAEQILASFLLRPADGWDAAAVAEP